MGRPPRTSKTPSASVDHVLMTVATRLKNARLHLKVTQKEVAERAEMPQSYLFEIETGNTNITLRTLAKLAEVLKLDIRTLFPGTGDLAPSADADEAMHGFLDKIHAILQNCNDRQSELLAEIESMKRTRKAAVTAAAPVPPTIVAQVHTTDALANRANRPGRSTK